MLFTLLSSSSLLLAEPNVINFLSLNGEEMSSLMQNQDTDAILEIPANTILPIRFFMQGDTAIFSPKETKVGELSLRKKIYIRKTEENLLISTDLQTWKPFLDFFTGELSIQLGIDEHGHSITLGVDANQRS